MQKTYCDRCVKDITDSGEVQFVTVQINRFDPGLYAHKHFCLECAKAFTAHIAQFLPSFFPEEKRIEPKKSRWK
jgi:hypothetical protein